MPAAAAFPSRETTDLIAAYYRIANPKLRRAVAALIRHAWRRIAEAVAQLST
jgi:hypothetical protein